SSTTYCSLWSSAFYWIRDTLIPSNTPTSLDFWGMKTESYNTLALGGNQLIDFSYYVHNYSDDAFNGTVYVSVYLSTNDTISTADTYLGQYAFNWSTGPKGTAHLSYDTIAPYIPSDTPSGQYYLGIIVNNADLTASNNDSSGQDAHPIFVVARPELDVRSVDAENGFHCVGESMDVDFSVQNWGGANVPNWTARIKMSQDSTITDSDWTVGTFNYGALNAGTTVNKSESITVPSFVAGPWYVGVIVETSSGEILESNNTRVDPTPINIGFCPDLHVVSVNAPDSGVFHRNDIMAVSTLVRNNGYTTSDHTNIHFYASTDTTITSRDYHLGWLQVSTPFAGQSVNFQANVGFPSMPDGQYYIGVLVDSAEETDYSDNSGYDSVRITYAGDPCGVDLNNDGTLDVFDIITFLDAFERQDRAADWNHDGSYDVFDVIAFLSEFDAGC
ncbi:MAG: hypothetical protein KDA28_03235, partial [Phycisphaerales bacterium]|nr:hypothetical protein [Phycisphaerales bacterium]